MNLILLTEQDQRSESNFFVEDSRAVHIRTVLQAAEGDSLDIGLVNGPVGRAEVAAIGESGIELHCDTWQQLPLPQPAVDLICALPRPQTVKKVLFTAGMCAVRRVFFIRANRVEKSFFHSPLLTDESMRPFLLEGMSQGKQTRLPHITIHERFRPFIENDLTQLLNDDRETTRLIPTPEARSNLAAVWPTGKKSILAAIGPEGGWVDFELQQFESLGFLPIKLGRWVLRVEHAVTTLLGQIELMNLTAKDSPRD